MTGAISTTPRHYTELGEASSCKDSTNMGDADAKKEVPRVIKKAVLQDHVESNTQSGTGGIEADSTRRPVAALATFSCATNGETDSRSNEGQSPVSKAGGNHCGHPCGPKDRPPARMG